MPIPATKLFSLRCSSAAAAVGKRRTILDQQSRCEELSDSLCAMHLYQRETFLGSISGMKVEGNDPSILVFEVNQITYKPKLRVVDPKVPENDALMIKFIDLGGFEAC